MVVLFVVCFVCCVFLLGVGDIVVFFVCLRVVCLFVRYFSLCVLRVIVVLFVRV